MDFSFTDEEREVGELARKILEHRATHEALTELERSGQPRFDATLWAELAAADLTGIGLPVNAGGSGSSLLAQAQVLTEIGRTVAPVPYATTIATSADAIAAFGSADQIDRWVRPAIAGELILAAALAEPLQRDHTTPATTARRTASGWQLDGLKTSVPAATIAHAIVVTATIDGGGTGAFVVPVDSPGVTIEAQQTSDLEPYGIVELKGVEVDEANALVADGVVDRLVERATLALCAVQLGVCERAIAETAVYTTSRVQFDRPIATFQAVGHRVADAYIDTEAIRLTLWQAIYSIESGRDARTDVQTAKFWAADGGHRVAHAVVHLHGGMGIATEHFIHRYFAYAKQIEFSLGNATAQALHIGAGLAAQPA